MSKWIKSKFPGVRFREHPTRKHGVMADKYYTITYKFDGKTKQEAVGWASEGIKPSYCAELLATLKRNKKTGSGPCTLAETREQKLLEETIRRQEEEELTTQRDKDLITFSEVFRQYAAAGKVYKKDKVLAVDNGRFKNWLEPQFGNKPMKLVTARDLEALQATMMDAGKSSSTIHHTLSLFRATWNWARKRQLISGDNPFLIMDRLKAEGKRERYFEPEELQLVLNWLKEKDASTFQLTLCAAHTGARLGEIAHLTWDRVDFRAQQINFVHTKSGKPRSVPMTKELIVMLKEIGKGLPSEPVFKQRTGAPWFTDRTGYRKTESPYFFRHAVEKLGLNEGHARQTRLTFHCLRHTAATILLTSGVDPRTVQEIMGWSTLRMLERYVHVMSETKRQAVNALEGALSLAS